MQRSENDKFDHIVCFLMGSWLIIVSISRFRFHKAMQAVFLQMLYICLNYTLIKLLIYVAFTRLSTVFQSYHMTMHASYLIYPLCISLYVTCVI